MTVPDRAGDSRPAPRWLWSCPAGTATTEIAERLGFTTEPVSELSARSWVNHDAVMDGLAAEFPMPDYFGRNWDAVDECVLDLCDAGRLIIVRDVHPAAHPWVALFADCVSGMWDQEPRFHPSGRVALVLDNWPGALLLARWPRQEAIEHEVAPLARRAPGSGKQEPSG